MPNGRTDIFDVESDQLRSAIRKVTGREAAAALFEPKSDADLALTLHDLRDRVGKHPAKQVTIEEQHWSEYVLHLGERSSDWVTIEAKSPAFFAIRGLHLRSRQTLPGAPKLRSLLWTIAGIVGLLVAVGVVLSFTLDDLSKRGQFGDMFGVANALFSGLAFAGVIYTILLQRHELSLQRLELQQTRAELARTAAAQELSERALRTQALAATVAARLTIVSFELDKNNVDLALARDEFATSGRTDRMHELRVEQNALLDYAHDLQSKLDELDDPLADHA